MIREARPAVLLPTVTLSDSAPIAAKGQEGGVQDAAWRRCLFTTPLQPAGP